MDICKNKDIKKKVWFDNLEVIKMKNFKGKIYPTIGMKYYLMNEINKEDLIHYVTAHPASQKRAEVMVLLFKILN